ncbi:MULTISPECIES: hypothetical protein [Hyphomonas]
MKEIPTAANDDKGHSRPGAAVSVVRVPKFFRTALVSRMWRAMRAERLALHGGRERFADYFSETISTVIKNLVLPDAEKERMLEASILSAETLDNFCKSGFRTVVTDHLRYEVPDNPKASQKTLSAIYLFLWALKPRVLEEWTKLSNLPPINVAELVSSEGKSEFEQNLEAVSELHNVPLFLFEVSDEKKLYELATIFASEGSRKNVNLADYGLKPAFVLTFLPSRIPSVSMVALFSIELYAELSRRGKEPERRKPEEFTEPPASHLFFGGCVRGPRIERSGLFLRIQSDNLSTLLFRGSHDSTMINHVLDINAAGDISTDGQFPNPVNTVSPRAMLRIGGKLRPLFPMAVRGEEKSFIIKLVSEYYGMI